MITADAEFLGESFEDAEVPMTDQRGLAVHGIVEYAELAAERFDHALQSEADAEYRNFEFRGVADERWHAEIFGAAGPGRDQDQARCDGCYEVEREARAIGHYFGAGLAGVIG